MAEHKSGEQLREEMTAAMELVKVGEIYSHYKNPDDHYQIKGFCVTEADDTVCVLYEPLYERLKGISFARPVKSFTETIEKDGVETKRFLKV